MIHFVIVSSYQIHENYSIDDPIGAPYWKAKGCKEVVCSDLLNTEQLTLLSSDELQAMVDAKRPESDEYFRYSDQSWEIVTLDDELVQNVKEFIKSEASQDLGYVRHCYGGCEFAFNWACRQQPDMLVLFDDQYHMNSWDKEQILKSAA